MNFTSANPEVNSVQGFNPGKCFYDITGFQNIFGHNLTLFYLNRKKAVPVGEPPI
jgi:hypothetical protein